MPFFKFNVDFLAVLSGLSKLMRCGVIVKVGKLVLKRCISRKGIKRKSTTTKKKNILTDGSYALQYDPSGVWPLYWVTGASSVLGLSPTLLKTSIWNQTTVKPFRVTGQQARQILQIQPKMYQHILQKIQSDVTKNWYRNMFLKLYRKLWDWKYITV